MNLLKGMSTINLMQLIGNIETQFDKRKKRVKLIVVIHE